MATKTQQMQDDADYADQFSQDEAAKPEMSEDEAMGIPAEEPAAAAAEEAPAAESATEEVAPVDEAAAAPVAEVPATDDPAKAEQKLKSWEGRLKAKEAELNTREKDLDAREAAMSTSSVDASQTSSDDGAAVADGEPESQSEAMAETSDAAKVLAEDFGAEFVDHLVSLIKSVSTGVSTGDNGLSDTVNSLIAELREERQANHFNSIKAAHEDFMDVVATPEFSAWKDSQPDGEEINRICESGSAAEIIAMLTKFKSSKEIQEGGGQMDDDSALDDAEGVRSGGIKLPAAPTNSNDYEAAWNEA